MSNILIVYHYKGESPARRSVTDHLYSFRRYSNHNCFYLNVAFGRVPRYLKKIPFDLIIFHTIFLSVRWSLPEFRKALDKVRVLKSFKAVKVVMPQDDFLQTDVVCDFINEFDVSHLFSASPESELPKLYPTIDFSRVKSSKVLTGYLDEQMVEEIGGLAQVVKDRPIDIGYRAYHALPWLGSHGLLKTQIAEVFEAHAPGKGIKTDISTRREDTFLGDDWYKFLLRCKYMIGVEGGASIADVDGTIRRGTEEYLARHPRASFEEVEAAVFPDVDGHLRLFVITPRHLESCATRTCQVLIEGDYDGILSAGKHYIEVKRDFSNLDEVLQLIKQDNVRHEITERAYRDIVESGLYTYRNFVKQVLEQSLSESEAATEPVQTSFASSLLLKWMLLRDRLSWMKVAANAHIISKLRATLRRISINLFSEEVVISLRRRLRR